jgi:poly(ADP-ribose) glycohydrolase ARH3
MMSSSTFHDRVHGMLAGAAVGDGLGAPFEGREVVPATALSLWAHSSQALQHTDDTVMILMLAEHLSHQRADRHLTPWA